ncbi:MAG: hypothetical protein AB8B87_25265 [Granulosicoccus sp.]
MSNSSSDKSARKIEPSSKADTSANTSQRYQWPPVRDPDLSYKKKSRNPVHSIITALPLIMLVIGLFIYYRGESRQTHSEPILAESVERTGIFTGLSATSGRHYLWLETDGVAKGVRIKAEQVPQLEVLARDTPIEVKMAPSVHESPILWAWYVSQSGQVFLDAQESLR